MDLTTAYNNIKAVCDAYRCDAKERNFLNQSLDVIWETICPSLVSVASVPAEKEAAQSDR